MNTVDDSGMVDAVIARQILRSTSREVQSRGWHFNTEKDLPLQPDAQGFLNLPATILRADTVGPDGSTDVVVRGTRLYDRRKHTYAVGTTLLVDAVVLLPFDELPEAARWYVTVRAARIYQERVVGSDTLSAFNQQDEMRALVNLQEAEADTADYNILSDNYAVARVLDR